MLEFTLGGGQRPHRLETEIVVLSEAGLALGKYFQPGCMGRCPVRVGCGLVETQI